MWFVIVAASLYPSPLHVELTPLDPLAARTIIRCWHRHHVEKLRTHSFTDVIAPEASTPSHTYCAAVRHDEVRAIAVLRDDCVVGIAHGPDDIATGSALVVALAQERRGVDFSNLDPRWRLEANYLATRQLPPASD